MMLICTLNHWCLIGFRRAAKRRHAVAPKRRIPRGYKGSALARSDYPTHNRLVARSV